MRREDLSMAGEYAVASEICRRGFYAQITLGRLKRTDILVYNPDSGREVRIEVKTKLGREWPAVKGINEDNALLIFVDFADKKDNERPDFYILTKEDWQDFLEKYVKNSGQAELIDGYIPKWKGKYKGEYIGTGVRPHQITQHKEKWEKLKQLLS